MSETEKIDGRGYRLGQLRCDECGDQAALFAVGWRAQRLDESQTDELPALAFRCPGCSAPGLDAI